MEDSLRERPVGEAFGAVVVVAVGVVVDVRGMLDDVATVAMINNVNGVVRSCNVMFTIVGLLGWVLPIASVISIHDELMISFGTLFEDLLRIVSVQFTICNVMTASALKTVHVTLCGLIRHVVIEGGEEVLHWSGGIAVGHCGGKPASWVGY